MLKNKWKTSSIIILIVGIVLLVSTFNTTIAWLKSESKTLISKFSNGNIDILLTDEDLKENNILNYEIIPGTTIKKNTYVTVKAGSEDCWLFVEINQTDNFNEFMSYTMEDGWQLLEENSNIYYIEVTKNNDDQNFNIIKENIISIKSDITNEQCKNLNEENYPSISFAAYAIQRNNGMDMIDNAKEAWLLINNQNN